MHALLTDTGTVARRPGSVRPAKVTETIKTIVEDQMRLDDETKASQLQADHGYNVFLANHFALSDLARLDLS